MWLMFAYTNGAEALKSVAFVYLHQWSWSLNDVWL